MFLERYVSNLERVDSRFENGRHSWNSFLGTKSQVAGPFKKSLGEDPEHVSRRKSNVLSFGIEMLAYTFNEHVLIKSARILLASFFISLRFF